MVMCCPLESSDEGGPTLFKKSKPVARKEHVCCECREKIAIGAKHEHIKGMWDGGWDSYRTCLMCVEIRDHFACNGWIYGQVWGDIRENFFPDMKCGGPCMEGLSPAAKAHLIDKRLEWLFEQDEHEQGDWEDWPKNKDRQRSRFVKPEPSPDVVWHQYSIERAQELRYEYGRSEPWEPIPEWYK